MSYTYDQRKRPQGPQNTEPERTTASRPGIEALMNGTARSSAAMKGRSFDLDAAMQTRMAGTFGDLSALKSYTPPARTQAALQTGPYSGPVTHAVSGASPSPSAAGPMQAKKSYKESKSSDRDYINDEAQFVKPGDANYEDLDPNKWMTVTRTPTGFFSFLRSTKRFKAKIDRRPWEMTKKELLDNRFNPNNLSDLEGIQNQISTAGSGFTAKSQEGVPQEVSQNGYNNRAAWQAFQNYSGAGHMDSLAFKINGKNWDMNEVDHTAFTNKLKNISRMVRDYPELKNHIGKLTRINQENSDKKQGKQKAKNTINTAADTRENNKPKTLRQRLKRKKGSVPPVNLHPPLMEGYQPNLNWQRDDALDPGWIEDPKQSENEKGSSTLVMAAGFRNSYESDAGHPLNFNSDIEGSSNEARKRRQKINQNLSGMHGTTLDYVANHELGHMLNFELIKELNKKKSSKNEVDPKTGKEIRASNERRLANRKDYNYSITSARLVEQALKDTMPEEDFKKLVRYQENSLGDDEEWDPSVQLGEDEEWVTDDTNQYFLKDQIDLKASGLGATKDNRGYTTEYGATNAGEFFAEAFADVYQNGADARPTSIRLVQLYEEEMKKAKAANGQ